MKPGQEPEERSPQRTKSLRSPSPSPGDAVPHGPRVPGTSTPGEGDRRKASPTKTALPPPPAPPAWSKKGQVSFSATPEVTTFNPTSPVSGTFKGGGGKGGKPSPYKGGKGKGKFVKGKSKIWKGKKGGKGSKA
jgi:hypothetical protein